MIYKDLKGGRFYNADCFDAMKEIPDGVIDMILCDLPYGTTACKWDTILPFKELWAEYKRVLKSGNAVVLTSAQPFTSMLICSQVEYFKYALIWKKSRIQHFAQAPYRFLTEHEDICIFSEGGVSKNAKLRMTYNPQDTKPINKMVKGKGHSDHRPSNKVQEPYLQTTTNYPKSILEFASDNANEHPTQKPVALFEYLIKTYTNEGDLVLDNTAGSGTTAIAAINTNRKWVCIEKDETYYNLAIERIQNHGWK